MIRKSRIFIIIPLFLMLFALPLKAGNSPVASHILMDINVNNDPSKGWVSFEFDANQEKPLIRQARQLFPDRIIITLWDTKLDPDLRNGLFYENLFSVSKRGIAKLNVRQISDPPSVRLTLYLAQNLNSYIENLNPTIATLHLTSDDLEGVYSAPLIADKDLLKSPADELDELIYRKVHQDLNLSGSDIDMQLNTLEAMIEKSTAEMNTGQESQGKSKYRIQSGDSLDIYIIDEPDFRAAAKVRPDGYITYPILGDVIAEGLTPSELAMVLKSRLMDRYFNYEIALTVNVVDYVPAKVYLIGASPQAGPVQYTKGMTVLDMLGKFDPEELDLEKVAVIRKGEGRIEVDLNAILMGDIEQNIELLPRDYIFVPQKEVFRAMVFGKVRQPGMFKIPDDAKVMDAIGLAGGFAARCDIRHIFILREHGDDYERIELDLRQFKEDIDETQNVLLQDRDIIFVPEVGRPDWDRVLNTLQQSSIIFYDFRRTLD